MFSFNGSDTAAFNTGGSGVRPASSLSSVSGDSGLCLPQGVALSRPPSGPPSPAIQINQLLHQTANLLAVNAQLRKEIEQVRQMPPQLDALPRAAPVPLADVPTYPPLSANHHQLMNPSKKSPKPDSYKTVMCQAWLESKTCTFAENCRFAHGEQELRPVNMKITTRQNNKYKTKLCDKYTTTGLCPYGTRCLFIHPDGGQQNAYIRADKIAEISQRHAEADARMLTRPATPPIAPATAAAAPNQSLVEQGPTPQRKTKSVMPPRSARPSKGQQAAAAAAAARQMASLHSLLSAADHRPHPSWPLEPPAFFVRSSPLDALLQRASTPDYGKELECSEHTPASQGYVSGESSPAEQLLGSPFELTGLSACLSELAMGQELPAITSPQSGSSCSLDSSKEEDEFDPFRVALGYDNFARELAKNLDLWS